MNIIKRKYRLMQAKKTFPCKTCISFAICKVKYSEELPFAFDGMPFYHYTINHNVIRLQILMDRCDLIEEWYDRHRTNFTFLYPQDKRLLKITKIIFKKENQKNWINEIKTRIQGWIKTYI